MIRASEQIPAPSGPDRPRFSIVTAVYNVERYLDDFIASIEGQRFPLERVEVIAVDDGSTDGSLGVLREWAERSGTRVQVFTKPNGGQGSARNLGLDHASGEWVTFPDPDDLLEPDYLGVADRFASKHPEVEVMSARPVLLDDATGRRRDGHPRRWQYGGGNRMASLLDEPNVFLGVSPGSFFRRDRIEAHGLRFDPRIRPNFEDGQFAVRYLLSLDRPLVGLLADAVYVYRKRADGSSTLQGSMAHPGRYGVVPELGYLDVLERARRPDGSIPAWVQQLIVYELSWYVSADARIRSGVVLPPELAPGFHELLDRILGTLDPAVVEQHRARVLDPLWRDLLAHAGRGADWHAPAVTRSRRDRVMGLRRFQYRYAGRPPREAFRSGAAEIRPAFQKTMVHRYFGRDLLWERVLWLPDSGDLQIQLDDEPIPLSPSRTHARQEPGRTSRSTTRPGGLAWLSAVRRRAPRRMAEGLARRARRLPGAAMALAVRFAARRRPFRARFRDAWVLMDRIHDADDNGERLFEHLRATRPDINAWFVLERDTPDWNRLRAGGERRLVAHGSWTWLMLMLNCSWLLASHVDKAIASPPRLTRIQSKPRWRLGFLQHGVTKDDLSRWLNRVELDLFVVSTAAELGAVAGDGSGYRFSAKETRLTGLPRFDRLLAKGRAVPPEDRNLVIVAPTWRAWLTLPLAAGSQRRELEAAFWESDYIRSWTALLRSPDVAEAVARRGWRLSFMPHPNLQGILGRLDLPAHVQPLSFENVDVQELYGRCALLVTDYSSVAFNLAYLDRPVVYFQFDRDAMLGGLHVGRKGYFDYERDGFGPVAADLPTAEAAMIESIGRGPIPAEEYQRRIEATFPERDGQASARVVAAVEELSRPWTSGAPAPSPHDRGGSV
ncbi:MAG TPA: glycosyltransferase [Candidatus Limnocylindria bacterium]|nr:glycosyltransferase [Candidatus Limnocylindria bacterium]